MISLSEAIIAGRIRNILAGAVTVLAMEDLKQSSSVMSIGIDVLSVAMITTDGLISQKQDNRGSKIVIITLTRCINLSDRIIGVLAVKDKIFYTLELPYLNNQKNISCIPSGAYSCVRHWSRKFPYQHLLLMDVPNRSGILIHAGNTPADTSGCILIAKGLTSANNLTATSRKAVEELMELIANAEITLRIQEAYSC